MNIEAIPVFPDFDRNDQTNMSDEVKDVLKSNTAYYNVIGFEEPWICYFAKSDEGFAGSFAFKGKPKDGVVEIAYQTFPEFRNKGIGSAMCRKMVEISRNMDPDIIITAMTLREKGHSTRILEKNNFFLEGDLVDEDGVEVWKWVYKFP